ncbi:V-set and immunoglobulin domain-containing protein 1-like isoform X4 [Acanthopagrus latus]|uniref:V-set and immunoglobulin domain-containing protein 1-like isoform X4 n=1 Tax=Acanthopagrus latus TaxID=8177 RepID=UPI00187C4BF7|nr:V-set and immunoglobulin domain-containing protein 1-like isoform X4 [Acanthopagrus latus]
MELLPLVCLCLLSCSGDGSVVVTVEEGSDAMLPCSINTKENIEKLTFDWKKGRQEVFFYQSGKHYNNGGRTGQDKQFEGRVFHFEDELKHGNASIKITRTQLTDSGNYACTFPPDRNPSSVTLHVGAAPKPFITILAETKDWVLLQCEAHGDPLPTLEWKDSDDNTLPADTPQISVRGGRSYITVNVTVTKADRYRCVATQEKFSHQIGSQIYVLLNGAASEPSVTTIKTDGVTVLQCVVKGASPKPKVEWKDSSGNILPVKDLKETERGDSYDIVLQTTLTKTDNFRCVVTQEEINHQIYAEIDLNINGLSAGAIAGFVVLSLLLVVAIVGGVGGGLYIKHLKKENREKYEEKREPQTEPDSSTSLKESS